MQAQPQPKQINCPASQAQPPLHPCPALSNQRYCIQINNAQCERLRRRMTGYGASTSAAFHKCEACEIKK